eukprot:GEZU01002859.1.p1 GENE.GEZU01002859.1~~GEZU01002859.1.p1  ORF type:complete len:555 (-),score=203.46 GEZU01002859.1:88-1752(-)
MEHTTREHRHSSSVKKKFVSVTICVLMLLLPVISVANAQKEQLTLAEASLKQGDELFSGGKYDDAVSAYTKALEHIIPTTLNQLVVDALGAETPNVAPSSTTDDPETEEARRKLKERLLYKRAEIYYLQKKYAYALIDLRSMLTLRDDSVQGHVLRGRIHTKMGEFQEALKDFQNAHTHSSGKNKEANDMIPVLTKAVDEYNQANNALARKDFRLCMSILSTLLSTHARESVSLRLKRAECALGAKDQSELRSELNRVLSGDQKNTEALHIYSKSLYHLGAVEEALSYSKQCLRLDPEHSKCKSLMKSIKKNEKTFAQAEEAYNARDFARSTTLYEQYLKDVQDPYNANAARYHLCDSYLQQKDADSAIRVCSLIIDEADALGHEANAEFVVQSIIARAEAHILKDDLESASRDAQKGLERDQNSQQVRQLQAKIERLKKLASRKNYYKILGVEKTADKREVKTAYRKLALVYHPDRYPTEETKNMTREEAENKFKDIAEAYEILSDDEKRAKYDNGEDVNGPQHQGGGGHPFNAHPFFFQQGGGFQHFEFRFN